MRCAFSDGSDGSTFDTKDQALLEDAVERGAALNLRLSPSKRYEGRWDIVKGSVQVVEPYVEPADVEPAAPDDPFGRFEEVP